jgi:AraC-like DNA-binding protein
MDPQLEIISNCQNQSFNYKFDVNLWTVWHFHPEMDILLNLKNNGHFICGDYLGELKPGTLIMIGPDVSHGLQTNDPEDNNPDDPALIALQFSQKSLGEEIFQKTEMSATRKLFIDASRCIEFLGETRDKAEKMLWNMKEMNGAQRFAYVLILLDLLANSPIADRHYLVSPNFSANLNEASQSRVNTITQYIMANLTKQISLAEAANLVNMSSKSFSRFFKKNTGKNFIQYVNELRIGHACRRLVETNDSVTEVCYDSGFNNLSNFNRRFLEIKQMSPREFRQEFCKQVGS